MLNYDFMFEKNELATEMKTEFAAMYETVYIREITTYIESRAE